MGLVVVVVAFVTLLLPGGTTGWPPRVETNTTPAATAATTSKPSHAGQIGRFRRCRGTQGGKAPPTLPR
jgi:hypothetical protein